MKLPGRRLRALAMHLCRPTTMQRVIDPLIADLQCEYADAVRRGRPWQAGRVRLGGYLAFWTALSLQIVAGGRWNAVEYAAVRRIAGMSILATLVVTALLQLPPLIATASMRSGWFGGRVVLFLIPQAIPLSLPVGLAVGIVFGLRGASTVRVRRAVVAAALVGSAASFVTLAWLVPEANQAFRALIAREHGGRLERGVNELSLGEMARRIETMEALNPAAVRLRFAYHVRYSISIAPVVLGLLALGISAVTRRRATGIVLGVMGSAFYVGAVFLSAAGLENAPSLRVVAPWIPDAAIASVEALDPAAWLPIAAAWFPNAVFMVITAVLWAYGRPFRNDHVTASADTPASQPL